MYVIGNQRKDDLSYEVGKTLARLCSSVLWQVELASYEIGYLAEEIFK